MEVTLVKSSDPLFAERLAKANMDTYYQARGKVWDHQGFLVGWEALDNYDIYADNERIGIVCLKYSDDTTLLWDLQILPELQGKGMGSRCMDLVIEHARQRGSANLALNVFSENPAIKLYESKGFIRTSEAEGLINMQLPLS